MPTASDRQVWDCVDVPTLRALTARAEASRGTPWPVPLASGYARYFRDGDRDAYEQVLWARQERLTRAAVLAAATLDPLWIDETADGVILLCEQSSWCWPAHDDTFTRHGAVVPTVTDPCVDLGAGDVAALLAWIDHLLGDQLDEHVPGVRARIRHEVDRRVLTPFQQRRDWHWLGLDGPAGNWTAWIHGDILAAALQLKPEPELIDLAVAGLRRFAAGLPEDGAIDEGYHYWWNGAGRLLEALELIGEAGNPQTLAFPHRMQLGGPWHLNLADGPARYPSERMWADLPWAALHRLARRAGDTEVQAYAAAHRRPDEGVADESGGVGRLVRALTDPEWAAARPGPEPLPRDVWLPSIQVRIARTRDGSAAGLTVAIKGGHNDEHHNHNDVGSVVIALNGVPVVVDAGRPTYTAQTFGPDRYRIWTMQSTWHNVPTIRGTAQGHGREYAARSVTVDEEGFAIEMADAYLRTDVVSWRRTARLDRTAGRVIVGDAWQLTPADDPEPTVLHLLLAGEVTAGPGRAEVIALDGAGVLILTWDPALPCDTVVRDLDDPMLTSVWGDRLTRLDIDVTTIGPVGNLDLTCEEQR
ncbi:heparinase II/III family protein [Actinoplanes sp. GCM10030250]|uniref:heparinase II/III domain-containing protein n=1 Tax=Actinoplanes sp. GCM10030250 TaxID=3273376 RepID=UPI0036181F17